EIEEALARRFRRRSDDRRRTEHRDVEGECRRRAISVQLAAERVFERASAIGEHADRRGIDGTERSEDERDAQRAAPIRPRTIVQRARRREEEHADEDREQRDDAYEKV